MRIERLLKDNYSAADEARVTVTITTTIGTLRAASDALGQVDIVSAELAAAASQSTPAKKTPAKKAPAKKAASGRRTAAKKASTAKPKPTAAQSKQAGATKKSSAGRVYQAEVVAAIRAGHQTPTSIAQAIKGDRRQVNKALSRYTKAGVVKRKSVGVYALVTPP